ncbi:Bug family tripartite tricarboxylate transporter substrate binding protein [Acidovorax sp. SDU_ACID1]|uniref:Bug family tripartite tricarboxylate transporter substrate binding protein n=1 Tax=Acidovorax sp. SDU_ACID1 TaxID=3136632 RepID=UPI003873560A
METSTRRGLLRAASAWASIYALPTLAQPSSGYPTKPVRFVVPYPPGGASDVTARLLADKLTESYGQSFLVDNKPGANGILALDLVAKAPADGYTILMGNVGPNAINAGLYPKLPFDPLKSFTPIMLTTSVPIVLLVNPSLPVHTTQELIAYAKAHPGAVKFASGGPGSATHLTAELFKDMAGIDIVHVPYKGDVPAMTDVIGGHVTMTFATSIAAASNISSGRLRVLGTASKTRPKSLAAYPTIAEAGVSGFESTSWGGVLAPAGTPPAIIKSLHTHLGRVLAQPDVRDRLGKLGADVVAGTSEEFGSYLQSEVTKWSAVIKTAGITPE